MTRLGANATHATSGPIVAATAASSAMTAGAKTDVDVSSDTPNATKRPCSSTTYRGRAAINAHATTKNAANVHGKHARVPVGTDIFRERFSYCAFLQRPRHVDNIHAAT